MFCFIVWLYNAQTRIKRLSCEDSCEEFMAHPSKIDAGEEINKKFCDSFMAGKKMLTAFDWFMENVEEWKFNKK